MARKTQPKKTQPSLGQVFEGQPTAQEPKEAVVEDSLPKEFFRWNGATRFFSDMLTLRRFNVYSMKEIPEDKKEKILKNENIMVGVIKKGYRGVSGILVKPTTSVVNGVSVSAPLYLSEPTEKVFDAYPYNNKQSYGALGYPHDMLPTLEWIAEAEFNKLRAIQQGVAQKRVSDVVRLD